MSKKLQQVKSEKQLIGGQLYLRLVVNCHGHRWVDIVKVFGSPFDSKSERKISTGIFSGKKLYKRDWGDFLTDLGVLPYKNNKTHWCHASGHKLFRFNSYSLQYLRSLDVFDACALLQSNSNHFVSLTDKQKYELMAEWEFSKRQDELHQQQYQENYYSN